MNDAPAGSARRVAKNTGVQTAGMAVSRIATLVFYVVMARELGQEGFGDYNFALSIGILVAVCGLGTDFAMTREIARDIERVHVLFWNAIAIRLSAGAAGVLIAYGVTLMAGYPSDVTAAVVILGAATWIDVLAGSVASVFRGIEEMTPIAASWVVQRVFTAGVGSAALLSGASLVPVCLIYLAGAFVAIAFLAFKLVRRGIRPRVELSWPEAQRLLTNSLPLAGAIVFIAFIARVDTVILSLIDGNIAVGIYGAAYRLFEGTLFVSLLAGVAAYPAMSRLGRETTPTIGAAYEMGSKALMVVLIPIGAVFGFFAEPLIDTLFGELYSESIFPMQALGLSVPLWGIFVFTTYVLASQDLQRTIGWVLVFGVALNIALNLLLIPPHSYDGAAVAMSASLALIDIALVAVARRQVGGVDWLRVGLSAVAGAAAMGGVALALGPSLGSLVLSLVAFGVVAYLIESRVYPDDVAFARRTLGRRLGGGTA